MRLNLPQLVEILSQHFGPQHWWPSDSPFETMLGAILTQNTSWGNVEKALSNIKDANLLDSSKLFQCPESTLEELIRPAGYFRQKTKKIKIFLEWFLVQKGGNLDALRQQETKSLREELLSLWGIGPETADAILCYALDHPVFVNDAYTVRLLSRHSLVEKSAKYEEIRKFAQKALPGELAYLKEAHALFVKAGKTYCHKQKPDCRSCPLGEFPISL